MYFQRYKDVLDVFLKTRRDSELEGKDIDKAKNYALGSMINAYEQSPL